MIEGDSPLKSGFQFAYTVPYFTQKSASDTEKFFQKNPLAQSRGFLIYYALVRLKAGLFFEKRQLEIKENYNVTR